MRIVTFATGPFTVPTLEWFAKASGHEIAGCVTRPARSGPGRREAAKAPATVVAERHGWPIIAPETANDPSVRDSLRNWNPDLFFVCDYGEILAQETLACARLGGINLHGSLLPDYRGAAPVQWAILDGCSETGVSVIHMTPRLDAGPILSQRRTPIGPDETAGELEHRLADLGVEAVQEALRRLADWDGVSLAGTLQTPSRRPRKAPRLRKEDGRLDWRVPAIRLANRVRAMQPWPGASTTWFRPDGKPMTLQLLRVRVLEQLPADVVGNRTIPELESSVPGTAWVGTRGQVFVRCDQGYLQLVTVRPENRGAMSAEDFQRGSRLESGTRFANPT